MSSPESIGRSIVKLPAAASVVGFAGLVDAAYLSVKHFTAEPVPCSIIEGCEMVLTSSYAEIAGVPLAALGAAAYFVAFSLALLAAFGNRSLWNLFGLQSIVMAVVSAFLIYLQAAVIGAFCQFCLISAVISFTLLVLYLVSRHTRLK